jgi:4-diphosphocytidyl-2-C-methyl-D-erythritol kinase
MKVQACAKVNLFLEVLKRRTDGYHEIDTVFQTVSLFDELTLQTRKDGKIALRCSDKTLAVDDSNLVMKAALRLKAVSRSSRGASIYLKKNIPLGAGLGGGSSDAAATLKGLVKLWKLKVSAQQLHAIAAELGADVPFFLHGGTARGCGIGDKITPVKEVAQAHFVLVNPAFPVATPWVYKNLRFPLTSKRKIDTILTVLRRPPALWGERLFNRLEEVVLPAFSEISKIRSVLTKMGCPSLMSGSGATVFVLADSAKDARRIQRDLAGYPWAVGLTEPVGSYKNQMGGTMRITEVRIFPRTDDKLKAYAAVIFDDVFVVHNLRVVMGDRGLMVCMPSRKKNDGTFADVAHPIKNDFRNEIERSVLNAYDMKQGALAMA